MTHCLFEQKFETRIQQKNSSMGDFLALTLSNFYNARWPVPLTSVVEITKLVLTHFD